MNPPFPKSVTSEEGVVKEYDSRHAPFLDEVLAAAREGDTIDEGATLMTGGARPTQPPLDKGFFVMPAVFTDVTRDMTITREEVFGPVIGIYKFSTDDEVLEAANDSVFGLCASVWTKDYARGLKLVNRLQAGTVWVNQHMNLSPETPWGGFKESGLGKEGGVIGPEGYTQLKLVYLKYCR